MEPIYKHNCIIGECPIWRQSTKRLYFVDPIESRAIRSVNEDGSAPETLVIDKGAAALAFTKDGGIILSRIDGVYILDEKSGKTELFADVYGCNDAKVGPDGRFYVGTQSGKRMGISDKVDGKLYRIDKDGSVTTLLDGLILSNGMDWSADGKKFYHTDSDTHYIKEYDFDAESGNILYTGRSCYVLGVDGLTVSTDGMIFAACWGQGHIAKIDTASMQITDLISTPVPIPSSCAFFGENMDTLAITSANYDDEAKKHPSSGYTFAARVGHIGKPPYLFG